MLNCSTICEGCPAQAWGEKRVTPDGMGSSGILLVGEGPWIEEIKAKRNFAGASGALLERCLRRLGMERSQFVIANATWCRTRHLGFFDKGIGLAQEVMDHCRPHLDQLIEQMKPKVIVALGGTALQRLCGVRGITNRHGYVLDSPYGIPVVASYHPSFILQGNAKYTSVLMFALRRAQEVAKGTWSRTPTSYILDDYEGMQRYLEMAPCGSLGEDAHSRCATANPSRVLPVGLADNSPYCENDRPRLSDSRYTSQREARDEASQITLHQADEITDPESEACGITTHHADIEEPQNDNGSLAADLLSVNSAVAASPLLVIDIETPKSSKLDEEELEETDDSYTIIRASISIAPATAVSFPWIEPFISLARGAVNRAAVVIMHNANFDRPRLENYGFTFKETHDSMWLWHFLQSDLPKGLGFVAPFYFDGQPWKHLSDGQPAYYSAVDADATMRAYLGIRSDLIAQQRWSRWLRHCVQVSPILQHMGSQGILIDRERQQALKVRLQAEYDVALVKLQGEVPAEVLPWKTWKRPHEGATEFKVPCPDCAEVKV